MIDHDLAAAIRAIGAGDPIDQLAALRELGGWHE
jgi:hypothetical protein